MFEKVKYNMVKYVTLISYIITEIINGGIELSYNEKISISLLLIIMIGSIVYLNIMLLIVVLAILYRVVYPIIKREIG